MRGGLTLCSWLIDEPGSFPRWVLEGDPIAAVSTYRAWMQHKYTVRFARADPETPPTMDEQIALARKAARRLGSRTSRASRSTA